VGRHDEAIAQLKRAVELDPLNLNYNDNLGQMYREARQYDTSIDQLKKTFEIDPNFAPAHYDLSFTYREMGKYDLWLEEWRKGANLADDREDLDIADDAARVYATSGYRAALLRQAHAFEQVDVARIRMKGFKKIFVLYRFKGPRPVRVSFFQPLKSTVGVSHSSVPTRYVVG